MPAITTFSLINTKRELLNKLRYGLNAFDDLARVTETTSNFTGDGTTTKFLLSATLMSYVKTITVGGVAQSFVTNYSIHWRGADIGKIEFVSAPALSAAIVVVWGSAGDGNFIYGDFPRKDLGLSSYPRIGFKLTYRDSGGGMGNASEGVRKYDLLLQVMVVDTDDYNIDYICDGVRNFINTNCKNFYYFTYVKPINGGEYNDFRDNTDTAQAKILEFEIPDKYEIVTYA